MGPSRSCWNGTTSALQPEITSKGTRVSCVYYQKKCPCQKSLGTYLMILVYIYIYIYIHIYIYIQASFLKDDGTQYYFYFYFFKSPCHFASVRI